MRQRQSSVPRRPAVHVTLVRASRLHRFVTLLGQGPQRREALLKELGIGLRTFYRELDLLKRCGIKVEQDERAYQLISTAEEAEGHLPFPDPQLSFAEMGELAKYPGTAARRLAGLLASVIERSTPARRRGQRTRPAPRRS